MVRKISDRLLDMAKRALEYSKKRVRSFGKKNVATPLVVTDNRLLGRIRERSWPSIRQLKYVNQFFSPSERRMVGIALATALISSVALFVLFCYRHTTLVPARGGDYSEAMVGQPKYLNPLFASVNAIDSDISSLVYSGLFRFDETGKLVPELVDHYTLSDDHKTYTLFLKKNIHWSDGEPFDAHDVAFTWELIQNPEVGSPYYASFQGIAVQQVDDYTVRFMVPVAFAPFLSSLTIGIIPEHVWGSVQPGNLKLAKNNLEPIGTGAWTFQKLTKDDSGFIQSYTLTRSKYFSGTPSFLDTITFKFFPDYGSATDAVRGQTVDALSFVPRESEGKLSTKNVTNYDIRLPQYTALFFNTQDDVLKNPAVRGALAGVVDKQSIVAAALAGDGAVIEGPILPGQLGYAENLQQPRSSVDAANAVLDKLWSRITPEEYFAGERERLLKESAATASSTGAPDPQATTIDTRIRSGMAPDQQFYLRTSDKQVIAVTIYTADTPEYRSVGEIVAREWRGLGIKTTVVYTSPSRLTREVVREHSYDVLLYGEVVGNDPDVFPFWHSSQINYPGLNLSRWSDKDADQLLETARTTFDESKRADLYRQFETKLNAATPAVFLYSPNHIFAVNKRINGVVLSAITSPESRYQGIASWYVKRWLVWKK